MLLRPAMKVIAARNQTSQNFFIPAQLLRPATKLIAARNKTRQSPFIPAKLLRPATKQVRTLQFSARQILNCLHSLRPVIDVIAARNKGGSNPEFAIFRDLFLGLEGV